MSRRCCCRGGECVIWTYNPTTDDIGQDVDPPWDVQSGTVSVVDGTGIGSGYDAVLKIEGPAKLYHRTPHHTPHYTGKFKVNVIYPMTPYGTRIRLHYNVTEDAEGNIGESYFEFEWVPYPALSTPQNVRFNRNGISATGTGIVYGTLLDVANDLPIGYHQYVDTSPDLDTEIGVAWRCEDAAGKLAMNETVTNFGFGVMEEPFTDGKYVGIEIPDSVTVYISEAVFYEQPDTYSGSDVRCQYCPCNYCTDAGESYFTEPFKPHVLTYTSNCEALDGQEVVLAPIADEWLTEYGLTAPAGPTCALWAEINTSSPPCDSSGLGEWATDPVHLIQRALGSTELPPYTEDWDTYEIFNPGNVIGSDKPNSNSLCNPFSLEFGPYYLFLTNPEDPEEERACSCDQCPYNRTGTGTGSGTGCDYYWFTMTVTLYDP